MTEEIRETKEKQLSDLSTQIYTLKGFLREKKREEKYEEDAKELEDIEESIEGFKYLLKKKKAKRKELEKELYIKMPV